MQSFDVYWFSACRRLKTLSWSQLKKLKWSISSLWTLEISTSLNLGHIDKLEIKI